LAKASTATPGNLANLASLLVLDASFFVKGDAQLSVLHELLNNLEKAR
jgi:hypothetical protein